MDIKCTFKHRKIKLIHFLDFCGKPIKIDTFSGISINARGNVSKRIQIPDYDLGAALDHHVEFIIIVSIFDMHFYIMYRFLTLVTF